MQGRHPDRLTHGVDVDAAGHLLGALALEHVGQPGGEFDVLQPAGDLPLGVGEDLAVLAGQQGREFGPALHEQFADLEENVGALGQARGAPARQGGAGGLDGFLDAVGGGQGDLLLLLAGGRVEDGAVAVCVGNQGAVDEVRNAFHGVGLFRMVQVRGVQLAGGQGCTRRTRRGAVDELTIAEQSVPDWPASIRRWKSVWTCSPISSERRPGVARCADREADVLVGQLGSERRGEVVVGGRGRHNTGHRVPGAQRPAVAGGDGGDVPEDLLVQAEPVGQHGTLGRRSQVDEEHEVVADLRGLAGGGAAGRDDVRGHRFDVFGRLGHGAGLAADHERQGCSLGAAHAAGDGGVDEAEAGGSGGVVQGLRGGDVDRGGIHQQRACVRVGQHAVLAEVHGAGVLALGEHGEDDVGTVDGVRDASGRLYAACLGGGNGFDVEVEAADVMPGLGEVHRHGPAHVPQSDPSDYCHGISSFALCCAAALRSCCVRCARSGLVAGCSVSSITSCYSAIKVKNSQMVCA